MSAPNVISTVDLGCSLDLKFIARRMWNVEYKPQVIREPEATVTIFQSGKIISLGTKSVEESRLAARKFARKLQKFGFPVRFLNFKIQNIVAFCQTFPVDLAELQKVHRGQCRSGDKDSEWRLGPNRDAGLKPNFDHITCQSTLLCAK
uniref:Uncharacterized protein n=1 Tax=Oreochromis niloticus TaxID=8128 RepID=I3KSC7_ORENI